MDFGRPDLADYAQLRYTLFDQFEQAEQQTQIDLLLVGVTENTHELLVQAGWIWRTGSGLRPLAQPGKAVV